MPEAEQTPEDQKPKEKVETSDQEKSPGIISRVKEALGNLVPASSLFLILIFLVFVSLFFKESIDLLAKRMTSASDGKAGVQFQILKDSTKVLDALLAHAGHRDTKKIMSASKDKKYEIEDDKTKFLYMLLEKYEEWSGDVNSEKPVASLEHDAFVALLARDYVEAKKLFEQAYKKFPTYHNVDEILRLLKQKSWSNSDADAKEIYGTILKNYSWGMEPKLEAIMRHLAGPNPATPPPAQKKKT